MKWTIWRTKYNNIHNHWRKWRNRGVRL